MLFCVLRPETDQMEDCRFIATDFFRTPLKDLDFTTCTLEGISVSDGGSELQGAVVNLYQAAELARLLGVIVKDVF